MDDDAASQGYETPSSGADGDGDVPMRRIPVTVLTGAFGAGKTTLLRYILEKPHGYRVAVIQNEFSEEMGIESPLITDAKGDIFKEIYELPNGCLCCSAKDSLIDTLDRLLERQNSFDYVLVEATGVADPESICEIFWVDDGLGSRVFLDGVVALVDGHHILTALGLEDTDSNGNVNMDACPGTLQNLGLEAETAKQVACADVIILNKIDLLMEAKKNQICAHLRAMNPAGRLLQSTFASVPLDAILGIQAFDRARVQEVFASLQNDDEMCGGCDMISYGQALVSPIMSHGIDSCLLRGRGPQVLYDAEKIEAWMANVLWEGTAGGVFRCKGIFHGLEDVEAIDTEVAETPIGVVYALQGVGKLFEVVQAAKASVTQNKFLFIGRDLKRDVLETGLRDCEVCCPTS